MPRTAQTKTGTSHNREQLKEPLQVSSDGIMFATIQKFFPEGKTREYPLLSERRNIIVITD
jgi:type I restriction enzyme R subunit